MGLQFDLYDFSINQDPYPVYARLREEAPVFRNEELDFWAVSRHAEVSAALRDTRRYSNSHGVLLEEGAWDPEVAPRFLSFLAMDAPQHTRMRTLVSRGFTPRRIAELEDRIRGIVRGYLDAALQSDEFDLVSDLVGRVPTDVICELTGIPESDWPAVGRMMIDVMYRVDGVPGIPPEAMEAAIGLFGHYAEILADRRKSPGEDMISALVNASVDGDRLTDEEIIGFMFLMIGAGNQTTAHLLGNAWYWAWRNPLQRKAGLGGRVTDWIEESLRYDHPSPASARLLTEEVTLNGVTIPAGERVLLLLGSANRDPRVFPDPERFDLDRDTRSMLTFGAGPHFCLGSALARLEARVVLEELAAHVSDYDIDEQRAVRTHAASVHGFTALPTTLTLR